MNESRDYDFVPETSRLKKQLPFGLSDEDRKAFLALLGQTAKVFPPDLKAGSRVSYYVLWEEGDGVFIESFESWGDLKKELGERKIEGVGWIYQNLADPQFSVLRFVHYAGVDWALFRSQGVFRELEDGGLSRLHFMEMCKVAQIEFIGDEQLHARVVGEVS